MPSEGANHEGQRPAREPGVAPDETTEYEEPDHEGDDQDESRRCIAATGEWRPEVGDEDVVPLDADVVTSRHADEQVLGELVNRVVPEEEAQDGQGEEAIQSVEQRMSS